MKRILLITVLALMSQAANAEKICKTRIMVLKDNAPAMEAVTVTIRRGNKVIATRNRHSFSIKLPCGLKYNASAKAGNLSAKRNFYSSGGVVNLPLN